MKKELIFIHETFPYMAKFRYLFLPILTISLIWVLNTRMGSLPPLGKFLDPFHGYLTLVDSDDLNRLQIDVEGLQERVTIQFDELRIPHIFAENEKDLYFAQGYVMAFERLWQMEFQTHAAGGRLSEIVGEKALGYDRFQRRIGMVHGANNALAVLENDPYYPNLLAFTKGINAYINTLAPNEYPLEYKIMDYAPEPWTPLKTCLLLKYMSWMLTGRSTDLAYTRIMNDFGLDVLDELYPLFPRDFHPVIPRGTPFDFQRPELKVPNSIYKTNADTTDILIKQLEGIGSNNWAVAGSRTKSGKAIMANDPHLGLNLPSIWYAMHLNCPTMNVMGVTLPGAPGIIMGFNDHISWGYTNGYDDVMDWYDIQFRDEQKDEYWYDNGWKNTTKVVEEIKIRGGQSFFDTVTYTHHGPVVWDQMNQTFAGGKNNIRNKLKQTSPGRALRWLAHDPSNESRSLYLMNKATNYDQFVEALKTFTCPGQNIIYSDVEGNIAIWHAGNLPLKWQGQGRLIMDGSDPAYDWQGTIPHFEKPHVLNPVRGYLSSANQHPVDETYPHYMSEFYWMSYRVSQINTRLDTLTSATIEDVRDIQLDNTCRKAQNILPVIIPLIDLSNLTDYEIDWLEKLRKWDYVYDFNSLAATFYDTWQHNLELLVWVDNFGPDDKDYIWPYFNKLDELIRYGPESKWFDDIHTEKVETLTHISNQSFRKTADELMHKLGEVGTQWQWQNFRGTDIHHLAKIPGMGRLSLPTSGAPDIVNATGITFGPSWRLAIEMADEKTIYGIYPGGQSGYPGSEYFDNMVDDWVVGNYYTIQFPKSPGEVTGIQINLGYSE